jgi:hypothetical protein
VESTGLLAQGGGFFGEGGSAQQILRRDVAVAGAKDRPEDDR